MRTEVRVGRAGLVGTAAVCGWWALTRAATALLAPALTGRDLGPLDWTTTGAAALALVAATWLLLLVLLEVCLAVMAGPTRAQPTGRRGSTVRTTVALVVAAAVGPGPAHADGDSDAVLRAPDRAESIAHHEPPQVKRVVVRPGDSLWRISSRLLEDTSPVPARVIQEHTDRLYRTNRGLIGPDPDQIRPGTRLRVSSPSREERA